MKIGSEQVKKLVDQLGADQQVKSYQANQALEKIVWESGAPGRDDERPVIAKTLAAELVATREVKGDRGRTERQPLHSSDVRRQICRHLAAVAAEPELEALRKALDDLEVREMARWALDRMTGDGVTKALVKAAVEGIGGEFRIGAINALARRAGAEVVSALQTCAKDADRSIQLAACEALASHSNADSDAVLSAAGKGGGRNRLRMTKARIRLAEKLAHAGQQSAAEKIYHAILNEKPDRPQASAAQSGLQRISRSAAGNGS